MFPGLHQANLHEGVRAVQQAQTLNERRHVRDALRLHGDLHDGRHLKHHVSERRAHFAAGQRGALQHVPVQSTDGEDISRRHLLDPEHALTHHQVQLLHDDLLAGAVVRFARIVRAVDHVHDVPFPERARVHAAEPEKHRRPPIPFRRLSVNRRSRRREHLTDESGRDGSLRRVAPRHSLARRREGGGVVRRQRLLQRRRRHQPVHPAFRRSGRGGQAVRHHLQDSRGQGQPSLHDGLQRRLPIRALKVLLRDVHLEGRRHRGQVLPALGRVPVPLRLGHLVQLPDGIEHALHEQGLELTPRRLFTHDLSRLGTEEPVTPQSPSQRRARAPQFRRVHLGERVGSKRPPVGGAREGHVAPLDAEGVGGVLGVGDDVGFDVVVVVHLVVPPFAAVIPPAVIERSSLRGRRQQRVRLRDELLRDEGAHDSVDLVEQVPHPLVRLRGSVSHLDDEPIELVEHEAHLQAFLPSLPEHRVGLHADALHHVHHHEPSVAEASRGGNLAAEVDVPR